MWLFQRHLAVSIANIAWQLIVVMSLQAACNLPCSMQVERQDAPWLRFEGKWGSTVEAPQRQEWYVRAENPVSRTWIQQVSFPSAPMKESISASTLQKPSLPTSSPLYQGQTHHHWTLHYLQNQWRAINVGLECNSYRNELRFMLCTSKSVLFTYTKSKKCFL